MPEYEDVSDVLALSLVASLLDMSLVLGGFGLALVF